MMTKEQFEAHVRAEAEVKYAEFNYRDIGPLIRSGREAYIATRMEHEWPLVEALQGMVEDGVGTGYDSQDDEIGYHTCCRVTSYKPHASECPTVRASAALSPYTAKPIEQ